MIRLFWICMRVDTRVSGLCQLLGPFPALWWRCRLKWVYISLPIRSIRLGMRVIHRKSPSDQSVVARGSRFVCICVVRWFQSHLICKWSAWHFIWTCLGFIRSNPFNIGAYLFSFKGDVDFFMSNLYLESFHDIGSVYRDPFMMNLSEWGHIHWWANQERRA